MSDNNGDRTELGIEALTEDIKDPEKRRAAARLIRSNHKAAKFVQWCQENAISLLGIILIAAILSYLGLK